VRVCVCVSVCAHSHDRIFCRFSPNWTQTCKPPKIDRGPENPRKTEKRNICLKCSRITEIPASYRKSGSGTRWCRQIFDRKLKYGRFAHAQWKICNLSLICGRIAEILASYKKSGSENTMVTSVFWPKVMDLWPGYGADTMFHRTYFLFLKYLI